MKTEKKHIAILCSRLDLPGGTERAICNFANLFVAKGHIVIILVVDAANTADAFYPLEKNITVRAVPLHFGITPRGNPLSRKIAFIGHISQLKNEIKQLKPDIVISTDYPYSVAAVIGGVQKLTRLVSWEPHHFYWLKKNKFWIYLFKKTYPKLHTVICLNDTEKKLFDKMGCHTTIIPGFVPGFPASRASLDSRELLTVGWFIKRKGIDLVPAIAKIVFQQYPDWKWKLVGKGEEAAALQIAIKESRLQDNILIIPPVAHEELEPMYHGASLYIMTSRSEGFPAVLIESMAHGVPCISFDCASGPSDIIRDNEDGKLVETENVEAMAQAIISLIADETKRKKMGEHAFINVQRYGAENIYNSWESAVLSL